MDINISISPAPGIISNYLVAAVYDSTAPTVVVASIAYPIPHTAPQNISFTNLNPTTYYVKVWESVDTTPTGTLRHSFLYDPSFSSANIRDDLFIKADTTPGFPSGQSAYVDASLVGWDYSVERVSVGTMQPSVNYIQDITGGWHLLVAGDKINSGETFVMHFKPQITTVTPLTNTTAGILFTGFILVTTDITLDSTAIGKAVLLQGVNPTLNVTLPISSSFPDNRMICFMSNGGNHINAAIKANPGDNIIWLNQTKAALYIGQSEELWVMKNGSSWHVIHADGNFKSVGEKFFSYQINTLNAVIGKGQTLLRAQYPRLWAWVQTLPLAMLVSDSTWNFQDPVTLTYPNKGFYSTGDGSTTFRVPLLCQITGTDINGNPVNNGGPGFLRGVDGTTRIPGSSELDAVGNFKAAFQAPIAYLATADNLGPSNAVAIFGVPTGSRVTIHSNLGIPGFAFNGKQFINPTTLNNETRPADIGAYLLIRT